MNQKPVDDKDELTLSKCHKAHIYIKDFGYPPDEVGFNCSVCNKKCDAIANPRRGLAGELQLLIGYDISNVADEINTLANAHFQKKYVGLLPKKKYPQKLVDRGGKPYLKNTKGGYTNGWNTAIDETKKAFEE